VLFNEITHSVIDEVEERRAFLREFLALGGRDAECVNLVKTQIHDKMHQIRKMTEKEK